MSTFWTDEKIEALRKMVAEGKGDTKIAKSLGCTRNAVVNKRLRMGVIGHVAPAFWTPERDSELAVLLAEGLSYSQIGVRMNCSKRAALGRAYRLGLKSHNPVGWQTSARPSKPKLPKVRDAINPQTSVVVGEQSCLAIPLLSARDGQCRWPKWDAPDGIFAICGNETAPEQPYCAFHAKLSRMPSHGGEFKIPATWRAA